MKLSTEIRKQFASTLERRLSSISLDGRVENWECRALLERLTSTQISLEQLADMETFFLLEPDAAVWTGCLSGEQFLQLLPSMMLVALGSDSPRAENLRGLLALYLSPRSYATERQLAIASYVYENLTGEQARVVEAFVEASEAES